MDEKVTWYQKNGDITTWYQKHGDITTIILCCRNPKLQHSSYVVILKMTTQFVCCRISKQQRELLVVDKTQLLNLVFKVNLNFITTSFTTFLFKLGNG